MIETPPSTPLSSEVPKEPTFRKGDLVKLKGASDLQALHVLGTLTENVPDGEAIETVYVWIVPHGVVPDYSASDLETFRKQFEAGQGLPKNVAIHASERLEKIVKH